MPAFYQLIISLHGYWMHTYMNQKLTNKMFLSLPVQRTAFTSHFILPQYKVID